MSDDPYRVQSPVSSVSGREARLSRQEILDQLKPIWAKVFLLEDREVSTDPEQNFIDWLRSLGDEFYETLDFIDFYIPIREYFRFDTPIGEFTEFIRGDLPSEDWEQDVKPGLTLGRLADWIGEQTQASRHLRKCNPYTAPRNGPSI